MKKKTQARRRSISADPITAFANKVISKKIIAGPDVRNACKRHLSDLKVGKKRGLYLDLDAAKRAIEYYGDVLRLNGGEYEGKPFHLVPWQAFCIGSIFGWKTADGFRRFRTAYIETGKGSGKSPLAAGVGLYGMTADHEPRAEIYAAATKKDQAMVLFRDAVSMVDMSPDLKSRLTKSGRAEKVWSLAWVEKGSFFRPIASDTDGQSGPRPHISLLDEVHEHKDASVIELLKAGQKGLRNPLLLAITNSGADKNSVCWDYHQYGSQICSGQLEDDSFFAFICSLDEKDDPLKDETCWPKANPSLIYGLPTLKYLREQVHQAKGMPSKESIVRRLNFCQWVESKNPWIGSDIWFNCEDQDFDESLLDGRRCWGGLDLSSTLDLTSFVLAFEPTDDDPVWRYKPHFWLPGKNILEKEEKDRVPYTTWRDRGFLRVTDSPAVDKVAILKELMSAFSKFDVQSIAYDRWRIEDLKTLMLRDGFELPLTPFGQGFKDMAPSVDEFESRLINTTMRHDGNPILTWCAANAVISSDPAGNRKVTKEKSTGRVDGIVAAIMATGASMGVKAADPVPEIIIL